MLFVVVDASLWPRHIFSATRHRGRRGASRSISYYINRTKKGYNKIVEHVAKTFVRGVTQVVKKSKNVLKDVKDIASATLRDIDVRLNQPRNTQNAR